MTAAGNRLYVVNSNANTLSVIDTTNNTVLGTIPMTSYPSAVAATEDGSRVYIGYYDTVAAVDINTTTNQVTGVTNIAIPDLCATNECYGSAGGLVDVVVSPDGRFVYAARQYAFDNGSPSAISYINPVTKTVISTGMSYGVVDMEFATDGTTRVYMADGGYHAILMEDAVTGEFRDMWFNGVDGWMPVARTVSINPAGTRVYAVVAPTPWDSSGTYVAVYDTDRTSPTYNTHIATITVPSPTDRVVFSADGTRAYAAHPGGKSVTVIDTATNTVIGTITSDQIGGDYAALSVGPDGTLYFSNYANDTVYAATVGSATGSQSGQFSLMSAEATTTGAGSTEKNPEASTLESSSARTMSAGADPLMSSLSVDAAPMVMAAAVVNSAPSVPVQPTGIPDPVSEVVTGQVVASDVDGNPLSYSVTGSSVSGAKVIINSATGAYTYTPTAAQRLAAGATSAADVDTFTVSVFDGQTTTSGTVPVYVSPTQLNVGTPIAVQRDPAGVAVYENAQNPTQNRTYAINQYDKTVSVIDTNPNSATFSKVVSTINLASSPTDIVLNSTGTRAYVSMNGNASVAVIDTQAMTVITNVQVGSTPTGIAISPDNSRVYVTNGGSSTVSVIDTALNKEISRITVGSQPNGVAVSPDGQRLYVTLRSTDSLAVVNLANNSKTLITLGDSPREVALTPDGKRAYVTNYDATVSVINTDPTAGAAYNTQIAKINTGGVKLQPVGVAIGPDGALAYVANGKDTVSVISTKTNTIVQTLTIDSVAESGAHSIALSPDGTRIYVTDLRDNNVRVLSLTRGNTAPLAIANPTVGAANPSNGAVSGSVNINDPDGDALTYSAVVSPTKGSLTFDPATGTYTFTPTQAARDPAARTPAVTFTIRATDPSGAYQNTTPITVKVSPTSSEPGVTPIRLGSYPNQVVVSGTETYVFNAGDYTVSVIDTTTNQVIGNPIAIGRYAEDMAAAPTGNRVYITHIDSVSVLNTTDNSVTVVPIPVRQDNEVGNYVDGIAVSRDGSRVYIGATDGTITVLNGSNNAIISNTAIGDYQAGGMEVSAGGDRLYALNYTGSSVLVIDTATMSVVQTITPGNPVFATALSPDGKRLYASGYYGAVSVIDTDPQSTTYHTRIATITVPDSDPSYSGSWDVAFGPQGSNRAYVTQADGMTVSVIDTNTNTVLKSVVTDETSSVGTQHIAVAGNGIVYVADAEDGMVYAVSVGDGSADASTFEVSSARMMSMAADTSQSSLMLASADTGAGASMLMAAAVVNSAPSVAPTVGSPDQTTGAVQVSLNGTDAEENLLTYSATGQPSGGSLQNLGGGQFRYTPSVSSRLAAGSTSAPDFDSFTVSVSDDQGGVTPVTVSVPKLPAVLNTAAPITVGSNPSGVAMATTVIPGTTGLRAYVVNTSSNTVSKINMDTGKVVATYSGLSSPKDVAVSPDGTRIYVTNSGNKTVTVINTTNDSVVARIGVGTNPSAVAVASTPIPGTTGLRAYVVNTGGNTVSKIDTSTNTVVGMYSGLSSPQDVAVSPDGTRIYVTNSGDNTVTVINTASNTVVATIPVGTNPSAVAIASTPTPGTTGLRAYVVNTSSNTVSKINVDTNTVVGTYSVGPSPTSVVVVDSGLIYVANSNDTVSVIDTASNAVIRTITIDPAADPTGAHSLAISPDNSRVYITDAVDKTVRTLSMTRGNTTPVAIANPTVETANPSDGAVSGSINLKDWDGDPLTYSAVVSPSKGSVTFDPATGTYTYTPTVTTRQQTAQNPGLTDTFTVRATDPFGATKDASVAVPILSPGNHAPTAPEFQYFEATDSVTGEVRGTVAVSDVDGDPLTYQLLWGPSGASSFTFDSSTGAFTYVPSREMREYVTLYPGYNDYDTFRVTISDGTASVSPWINMEVRPIQMAPYAYYPPEVRSADPATGAVSGSMNVYDPNWDTVSFSINSGPTRGTASVDSATGIYTYTPFASQRAAGGIDTFTVSATDSQDTSTFTVTVPVRVPELASTQTQIALPSSGTNIAVSGSRAYVFNKYQWTVSAIDINTNTVLRTSEPLASGSSLSYPGNVAVSPDGTRVYVANWVEGKIIRLDPTTLAPVGQPIPVAGGGDDMVFSPDGSRLYVAHDGAARSLSIIDTAGGTVIGTISTTPDTTDMVISADGRTLYVADGYYNQVQVIDTNTTAVVGTVTLGYASYNSSPGGIALSPDGRWAYVTNPVEGTVSVIDTSTRTVVGPPIVVGVSRGVASTTSWPTGITTSPDGSRIYVAYGDDIVVINAATRTLVGAVRFPGYMSDTSNHATQGITVDSNGDILSYGGSGIVSVTLGTAASQKA